MNILQILPELNVGGVESGTVDLAKALAALGHKAVVVSNGGELVKELELCAVKHYELPVKKKSLRSIIKTIPRLKEIIRSEQIDIVHARSRVPAWIAYFACRGTHAIFLTTCHGYYRKHIFSQVMGWGKRVISVSNAVSRHMIDDFSVPREHIVLVPRGVDLEKFSYIGPENKRKKTFNVGIIGRITPIKGHLYFIKAMARVARSIANLQVLIVGDAPDSRQGYKEELTVLINRLGLNYCTRFLGTQRDIPSVLSKLDLLVLATTTNEAFGKVIIEAQACGVPVVATKVGGIIDVIEEEKTGLLVPAADHINMAEAVVRIYKDPEFARFLAENAYKRVVEKYNLGLMVKNTLAVYEEAMNKHKILIIKLSSLGDVILSTVAIKAVRKKFGKNYKINLLVGNESKDVFMRCPYIDELLIAEIKDKDKGIRGIWRLGKELRKRNFDYLIDLQNNRKSHLLSFLSLCLERYGYDNGKLSFLLNHTIKEDKSPINPVEHQFRILKKMGIEKTDYSLELWPGKEDEKYIEDFLISGWMSPGQLLIGINISASARWVTKSWPLPHLARLCQELEKREMRIVLSGMEDDLKLVDQLQAFAKNLKFINACGRTNVNQLASLIKRCAVYISADSSPLHIAAAMKTPFVALFGPTDFRRHLPPAKNSEVIAKELKCSPCYRRHCKTKKCMEQISAQEVLAAVMRLLKSDEHSLPDQSS